MSDYEVSRPTGRCAVSGRAFEEGEEFYTAVFESPEGLERRDYAPEAWQGPPEGALCHFKSRMPLKDAPKRTFVDDDVLIDFFLRLADAEAGPKLRFRFVLSLILMRKRLLKYETTLREAGREVWRLRLTRDKGLHRVINPSMNEAEIADVSARLGSLLHADVAGDAPAEAGAAEAVREEEPS